MMSKTLSVVPLLLLLQASIILVVGGHTVCLFCSNVSPPDEPKPAWNGTIEVNGKRSGSYANFTWTATPKIPNGLNVYVKYEMNYPSCEDNNCVCAWDIKKLSDYAKLYLNQYINARVTVKVGEVEGSSNITAAARIPSRKVKNLTCSDWSCEATVDSDCSFNNGPNVHVKFQLDAWNGTDRNYSLVKSVEANITKNFTARLLLKDLDLLPLTKYSLTAYTANSNGTYEDLSSPKEYFTTQKAPMNVTLVMRQLDEKNQIQLSWKLSSPPHLKQKVHYTVSLCQGECVGKNVTTNNTVTIPLDKLAVGQIYNAKVQACIMGLQCSKAEFEMWKPPKPVIQENKANVSETTKTTDTTITTPLPVLLNPPGWHWVAVKKDEENSENNQSKARCETIKAEALKIVHQEKDAMKNESSHSHDENSPTDRKFHIMEIVRQEEMDQEKEGTNQVTIGDDESPLQKNTKYIVVIVTETRGGGISEFHVSPPHFVSTKPDVHPASAMLMIVGICLMAVLLGVVVAVLWKKSSNRRRGRRPGVIGLQSVQR